MALLKEIFDLFSTLSWPGAVAMIVATPFAFILVCIAIAAFCCAVVAFFGLIYLAYELVSDKLKERKREKASSQEKYAYR